MCGVFLDVTSESAVDWLSRVSMVILEFLAGADFVSDILILRLLIIGAQHPFWTAITIISIIGPYLISYSALGALFQRKKTLFTSSTAKQIISYLYVTPFSFVYLVLIDVLFIVFTLISVFI